MYSSPPHRHSIDLSHHLNTLSRARVPSPLKHIFQYYKEPGMISLAGGMPHPTLFPFNALTVDIYTPDAPVLPGKLAVPSSLINIPKYSSPGQTNNLSSALQYATAHGSSELSNILHNFIKEVLKPGYDDYEIFLHCGNTDGWNKIVDLVCERGDYIVVEEFTFSSAQSLWTPMGCKGVPISSDSQGMIVEDFECVLANWETDHPGEKRPRLLYTVPVCQNPIGSVLSLERKTAIYELCVKYDVIICEDDPYYFLQYSRYVTPERRTASVSISDDDPVAAYLKQLVPPFLNIDYQGRVIRLDSFSKTVGPGLRLGYFVCNPVFAERLIRATEVISQSPNGLAQALIQELLTKWGPTGYIVWLKNLAGNYAVRRDWAYDILTDAFDTEILSGKMKLLRIPIIPKYLCSTSQCPRQAGMFIWLKIILEHNPEYQEMLSQGVDDSENKWFDKFWKSLVELKVILTPGKYFNANLGNGLPSRRRPGFAYCRLAYSYETYDEIKEGVARVAKGFQQSWHLE